MGRTVKGKQAKLFQNLKEIDRIRKKLNPNHVLFSDYGRNFEPTLELMAKISNLGPPFQRHKPGSAVYTSSLKKLVQIYRRYGHNVYPTFQLAHEYFNNPKFVYHPANISISDFIYMTKKQLQFNEYAQYFYGKFEVVSLFKEFLKGRDYINSKFLKIKIQKTDNALVSEFIVIWELFFPQIEEKEKIVISEFIANCEEFSEKNKKVNIRSIFFILENQVFSKSRYNVQNIGFINSKFFWNIVLPKELIRSRLFDFKHEINYLEKLLE